MNKSEIAGRLPKRTGFIVKIHCHTKDAFRVMSDPQTVRDRIGEKLDLCELCEEVDYTLEVSRFYE